MGLEVKSIDPKSTLRKLAYNVFGGTASNNTIWLQVPVACTFDKAVFGRGLASATCVFDVSNASLSASIVTAGSICASASGLAGTVATLSACNTTYLVSANSILKITLSGTTTDGALSLIFSIDENKEK
jgi:hypothetical protein